MKKRKRQRKLFSFLLLLSITIQLIYLLIKYKMKLTIQNTTRRGNSLYIKRTYICVAQVEGLCVTIKNFDTDELHWCKNTNKKDIQKYIISEIRKDKRLFNKYKML